MEPHILARTIGSAVLAVLVSLPLPAAAASVHGREEAALGARITQAMVVGGAMSARRMRLEGLRVFSTPFNELDGLGDGPLDPANTTDPGGRPSLQDNGVFLRVNGLDSQTCLECHSVLSNATIPARFAPGGVGGAGTNVMAAPTLIDVADVAMNGFAEFNGRFINPPFVFGSGGVELLGKEMTADLQALKAHAEQNPGTVVPLVTKGISFGSIVFESGQLDTSNVEGVDPDLVVRPFGRKGEFATTRAFALGAMKFHFGMQPIEDPEVGADVDADGDGVANEVLIGEMSVLHAFMATADRPRRRGASSESRRGRETFETIGCASCHVPSLRTSSSALTLSFPETETDPSADVYTTIDIGRSPAGFRRRPGGGVEVDLFADLKRHDMGPALAESRGGTLDAHFTTARLWGVADTAPYLHDGRATTLTAAILLHGGDAQASRDQFAALPDAGKEELIAFLRTLRTPRNPRRR